MSWIKPRNYICKWWKFSLTTVLDLFSKNTLSSVTLLPENILNYGLLLDQNVFCVEISNVWRLSNQGKNQVDADSSIFYTVTVMQHACVKGQ